jgi:hypothetical protein
MSYYDITLQHTEKTFLALSRMQYDIFWVKRKRIRALLCIFVLFVGIRYFDTWWGLLFTAYGCFALTGTYIAADRRARKLSATVKASGMGFPFSEYVFLEEQIDIFSLPEKTLESSLPYQSIYYLGEDRTAFYLFLESRGGYMILKESLGTQTEEFRTFIEKKTHLSFYSKLPPLVRLLRYIKKKRKKGA